MTENKKILRAQALTLLELMVDDLERDGKWTPPVDGDILLPEALTLVEAIEEDVLTAVRGQLAESGALTSNANWRRWAEKQEGKLALLSLFRMGLEKRNPEEPVTAGPRSIYERKKALLNILRKELQKRGPDEVIVVAEGTA